MFDLYLDEKDCELQLQMLILGNLALDMLMNAKEEIRLFLVGDNHCLTSVCFSLIQFWDAAIVGKTKTFLILA